MPSHSRWWALFALSLCISSAWLLASPRLGGPDEIDHSVRAVASARGDLLGDFVLGQLGYRMAMDVPASACRGIIDEPEVCIPGHRPGTVVALTNEWRHPPPYYLIVGAPSLASTGANAIYAMRLVSALIGSVLLSLAFASALDSGVRLLVLAVFAGVTPATWFLIGVVNPNGIEIAAAICLWSSLLVLATHRDLPPRVVPRAGLALVVLVMTRGISPVYGLVALAAAAVLATPARRRELARRRDVRTWLVAAAGGTLVTGVWVVVAGFSHNVHRDGHPLSAALRETGLFLRQSVGDALDLHVTLPVVLTLYAIVVVPIVYAGLTRTTSKGRVVLVCVLAVAFVLPITSNTWNVPSIASAWQGRYGLPLMVGVVIIAASIATTNISRTTWRVASGLVVAAQIVAFVVFARSAVDGALATVALVALQASAAVALAAALDRAGSRAVEPGHAATVLPIADRLAP